VGSPGYRRVEMGRNTAGVKRADIPHNTSVVEVGLPHGGEWAEISRSALSQQGYRRVGRPGCRSLYLSMSIYLYIYVYVYLYISI